MNIILLAYIISVIICYVVHKIFLPHILVDQWTRGKRLYTIIVSLIPFVNIVISLTVLSSSLCFWMEDKIDYKLIKASIKNWLKKEVRL